MVTTIAGSTEEGNKDGEAGQARFKKIAGIFWKNDGTLYIADNGNDVIKTLKDGIVSSLRNTRAPIDPMASHVPLYVDSNDIIYTMLGGKNNPLVLFIPESLANEEILQQTKITMGYFSVDLQF